MNTTIILLCILFMVIIFGMLAVFVLLFTNRNNREENTGQESYCPQVYGGGWHLEFFDAETGQTFAKNFKDKIFIGRDNGSTELFWQMYVGRDQTISREQCVIYDSNGSLVIENKSRTNVTQLNGYPVVVPYLLDENSCLRMGRHNFYVTRIQQTG